MKDENSACPKKYNERTKQFKKHNSVIITVIIQKTTDILQPRRKPWLYVFIMSHTRLEWIFTLQLPDPQPLLETGTTSEI